MFTEDSMILAPPSASADRASTFILALPHGEYSPVAIGEVIVPTYFDLCLAVGIDPILAIAQMIHETGNLTSFWSARPQRNPAGIGVTGEHRPESSPPEDKTNWEFNTQRRRWEVGLSFLSWKDHAIPAHVGRLLAYALPQGTETTVQQALIERALAFRMLPDRVRGSAPTLKRLGKRHNPSGEGWASPGDDYGARLAAIAREIALGQI